MSSNKIKQTCSGSKVFAACTEFQGVVSSNTNLTQTECLDVQEVIEDLYSLVDTIKEEIDVTTLENTCITFTEPKTPSSVIEQMYNKICELQSTLEEKATLITTIQEQIALLQNQTCP